MAVRPAGSDDLDAVSALGVTEEAAWFGAPEVSMDEVEQWLEDEGGVSGGLVSVSDGGDIWGFASPGRHQSVFLADPARTDGVADELLPWLREQRHDVQLMTFGGDPARIAAFERHGLRHRRSVFSLIRQDSAGPLPAPTFPDGVDVAPYRVGYDDEAVHHLIYV